MKNIVLFFGLLSFFADANAAAPSLKNTIISIEKQSHGKIGVAVLSTQTQQYWSYRGNERFALMSTFKTLACAKMLADSDHNILNKQQTALVDKTKMIPWSPITEQYIGKQMTLEKLCEAAMLNSDNTAINLVLSHIGGPAAVTKYLQQNGDSVTRIDRIEPELNTAFLNDPRDTSTPLSMVNTLHKLLYGSLLSNASKEQLKNWMMNNQVSDALLRSILPSNLFIADRTGAGNNGSRGITAVIWGKEKQPLIISIYLTQTTLSIQERDKVIVKIGERILQKYGFIQTKDEFNALNLQKAH
ncbi:class A beta-lactamase [Thiomicrorhabdus sp. Kp2]|uniref:class A beta-lactamase n=1 Tax=Thiomicrorhabdus sp. Kp2 TaxID=1123518 RepID=UPI0004282684|nr:class A beta-lactamase [Thiomicrorhabdus sp. Kp2]